MEDGAPVAAQKTAEESPAAVDAGALLWELMRRGGICGRLECGQGVPDSGENRNMAAPLAALWDPGRLKQFAR